MLTQEKKAAEFNKASLMVRKKIVRKFTVDSAAVIIAAKFFMDAWAVEGDKVVIPNPTAGNSASYTDGWTPAYSADPEINPDALQVPRTGFNGLLYDITLALQQLQVWGIPNFITEDDNAGDPFPYSKNALALYDNGVDGPQIYQSLEDENENIPGDASDTWRLVDNTAQSCCINFPTFGTGGAAVTDGDAVYWDPGNSWYAPALANGGTAQNVIGIADVTNKRIYTSGIITDLVTGLPPGEILYLSGSLAGELTNVRTNGYEMRVGVAITAQSLALSIAPDTAPLGMPAGSLMFFAGVSAPTNWLAITTAGQTFATATYPLLYTAIGTTWGGDATNAGLPDPCRMFLGAGSGGGLSTRTVGQSGGEETHTMLLTELVPHTHDVTAIKTIFPGNSSGGDGQDTAPETYTTTSTGSGAAFNVLNPYNVGLLCIKVNNL